jgi:hypothetical protein
VATPFGVAFLLSPDPSNPLASTSVLRHLYVNLQIWRNSFGIVPGTSDIQIMKSFKAITREMLGISLVPINSFLNNYNRPVYAVLVWFTLGEQCQFAIFAVGRNLNIRALLGIGCRYDLVGRDSLQVICHVLFRRFETTFFFEDSCL